MRFRQKCSQVTRRVLGNIGRHTLGLQAAGIGFFGMLAAFPAMAALISLYAMWANPSSTIEAFGPFRRILPHDAWQLLDQELIKLTSQQRGQLSSGALIGVVLTLWSSGAGVRALITSLNVVYMEAERRGLLRSPSDV